MYLRSCSEISIIDHIYTETKTSPRTKSVFQIKILFDSIYTGRINVLYGCLSPNNAQIRDSVDKKFTKDLTTVLFGP